VERSGKKKWGQGTFDRGTGTGRCG